MDDLSMSGTNQAVIIHSADFHIDSPFKSFQTQSEKGLERREEQLRNLARVVAVSKENRAQFLLIAGDLFDSARVSEGTLEFLNNQFSLIPEITVCIAPGNHDPYTPDSPYKTHVWPDNVFIFKDNFTYIEKENVRIYGRGFTAPYTGKTLIDKNIPLDENYINILLMHGDTENPKSVYNPIKISDLEKTGFDYIALGHIHKRSPVMYAGRTPYCYSGVTEGRGFDECGDLGVMRCKINKASSEIDFISTCVRKYIETTIDITGCESNEEILNEIYGHCPQDDNLYKIVLTGTVPDGFGLSTKKLLSAVADKYYFVKIEDATSYEINLELLSRETSSKGIFVKKVLASDMPTDRKQEIIKLGLQAFEGDIKIDED